MPACRFAGVSAAAAFVVALAGCGDGGRAGTGRTSTTEPSPAERPLSAASVLGLRGLDRVRVGMDLDQAAAAAGWPLKALGGPTAGPACQYYRPLGAPDGIAFMVVDGHVARTDIIAGAVATEAGVTIGQSEAEAQRRYGGRLQVSNHHYTEGGHYLTLVPTDAADAGYRLVLETDGAAVTDMRAGRLPEVEFVEGCS